MRLVIGVSSRSAPRPAISIAVHSDDPVIGLRDLAPQGLKIDGDDASNIEVADARARFEIAGENTAVILGERRSWSIFEALVKDDAQGLIIYDDAVDFIAKQIEDGANLNASAEKWITTARRVLSAFDACTASTLLVNSADIATGETEFSYLCDSKFDKSIKATPQAAPVLEYAIAAQFVSTNDQIKALAEELFVRSEVLGSRALTDQARGETALTDLRTLHSAAEQTVTLEQENALLREQLHLAQFKAETYYKKYNQSRKLGKADAPAATLAGLSSELEHARHEIAALKQSTSWKVSAPVRVASRIVKRATNLRSIVSERRHLDALKKSELFDADWYCQKYPDVAAGRLDPAKHFLRFGGAEGRSPSPKFNASNYLKANPDVAHSGLNPLIHYIQFGQAEARATSG